MSTELTELQVSEFKVGVSGVSGEDASDDGHVHIKIMSTNTTPVAATRSATEGDKVIALAFQDIKASVQTKNGTLDILKGISGYVAEGEMVALMGSSGAGKTTLLNVLSGRGVGLALTGEVLLYNQHSTTSMFRKLSSYVTQDDILPYALTPEETLSYTAELRLGQCSAEEKAEKVAAVLDTLGLTHVKHTPIGEPGMGTGGISGGERKRVNVGNSLITNPKVLYLDEPTSGLDSKTAHKIMKNVKQIVQSGGRACISTIHQPSKSIFDLFDKVFILAQGSTIYFGSTKNIIGYFDTVGLPCPQYMNIADHVIEMVIPETEDDQKRVSRLLTHYAVHEEKAVVAAIQSVKESETELDSLLAEQLAASAGLGPFGQFRVLLHRAVVMQLRHKMLTKVRLVQMLAIGLMVGLVYLQVDNSQSSVNDRLGAFFMIASINCLIATMGVLFAFPAERALFLREYQDGSYSVGAYFAAKVSADTPFQILFPTIFSVISYYMIGFQDETLNYLQYNLVCILLSLIGASLGFAISAMTGDVQTSLSIAPMIFMVLLFTAGFLVTTENMPWVVRWISYLNPFRYGFIIYVVNELKDLPLTCEDWERVPDANGPCPMQNGQQVLNQQGYALSDVESSFIMLAVIFAIMRSLGYFVLKLKVSYLRV